MKRALIYVTAFSIVYGLTIAIQQSILRSTFHPLHLNFYIYFISAVILTVILVFFNRSALKIEIEKRTGLTLAILSGFLGILADLFVFFGLQQSSSINWSIIFRLSVLSTFSFSVLFLKERFSIAKTLAICLSITGAIIIVIRPDWSFEFNIGDLFFIGAMITYGLLNVVGQKSMEYITPLQHIYFRILSGGLFLILPLFFVPIQRVEQIPLIAFNVASALLGITFVTLTIKEAGATFFSVGSNLVVLFAMIFSIILLSEWPSVVQIIGALIVISSIFLFEWGRSKNSKHLSIKP